MCRRSFKRLLQGLYFQYAHSLEAGPKGRHTSLRITDRSVHVARTKSVENRHVALNCASKRATRPLIVSRKVVSSHRSYSQSRAQDISWTPSHLDRGDMVVATNTGSQATPADILNEDTYSADREACLDPESDVEVPLEADELKEALGRPPPVNSSILPLPWKGRLGYVSCTELGTSYHPRKSN